MGSAPCKSVRILPSHQPAHGKPFINPGAGQVLCLLLFIRYLRATGQRGMSRDSFKSKTTAGARDSTVDSIYIHPVMFVTGPGDSIWSAQCSQWCKWRSLCHQIEISRCDPKPFSMMFTCTNMHQGAHQHEPVLHLASCFGPT